MITVTDTAKKQALRLMEDDGKDGFFIRVGVEGGGCSGLMYQLTFDNEEKEGDKAFEDNGIKVVVDKKSYLYLIGTTLDFSGGLNGKGFVFNNFIWICYNDFDFIFFKCKESLNTKKLDK
jgi:iron-sulfur cluster assembly protein